MSTVQAPAIMPDSSHAFEMPVEGVRGMAMLLVALGHCLAIAILDPSWSPPEPWPYFQAGHAGVMLFFMLSGYVIGLTNPEQFSPQAAKNYLSRRALRILPIYIIAWIFSVVVSSGESVKIIFGNLFFLQNLDPYFSLRLPPIGVNGPLWSLHYEVVYYILFLALWRYRPPFWLHFTAALALGVLGWSVHGFPFFIAGYGCGWLFWSTGWWLSRQPRLAPGAEPVGPLLSGILLLMATHHFACGHIFLNGLGFKRDYAGLVNLSNISLLPSALLIMAAASRRKLPGARLVTLAAFGQVIGTVVLLLSLRRMGNSTQWLTATAYAVVACIFAGFRGIAWLKIFAPLGKISYAFYVLHFPMLFVVQRLPLPHGSFSGFALRAATWLILTTGAAWLLERAFQVRIKNWWLRHRPNIAPAATVSEPASN
jgi:peptidoglycan/LPS O-acetylase OafA/YrhL